MAERDGRPAMLAVNDALDAIFLGCFLFGLLFVVGTLILGAVDIGGDFGHHGGDAGGHHHDGPGLLNLSSILAFVGWFGGVGYLMHNGFGLAGFFSIILAIAGGLAGGWVVWQLLRKLKASEQILDPNDYRLPGTIARVTSSIRVGGVGEIVYEQQGIRQVAAARSLDNRAIPRGAEVVVMETAGGIALVQSWEDALAESDGREREPDRLPVT
jgi:hypothetical protein